MSDSLWPLPTVRTLSQNAPLIQAQYPWGQLLAATAVVRARRLPRDVTDPHDSGHWLSVPKAREVAGCFSPPHSPLTESDDERIALAVTSILNTMPEWKPYFSLPMEYRLLPLESNAISMSAPHWPQVIFLSPKALASGPELQEQLIHEHCHQWQYLLEESVLLAKGGVTTEYTLPSGTAERSLREVIGAAHVAAVLASFYRRQGDVGHVQFLVSYAEACLSTVSDHADDLTQAGRYFCTALKDGVYGD